MTEPISKIPVERQPDMASITPLPQSNESTTISEQESPINTVDMTLTKPISKSPVRQQPHMEYPMSLPQDNESTTIHGQEHPIDTPGINSSEFIVDFVKQKVSYDLFRNILFSGF